MIRYLILGLLRDRRPRHGYALMKEYRDGSGRALSIGNVYRELQRLRNEGFVRTCSNPPDSDPRRLPYEITDTGCSAFDAWLHGTAGDENGGGEETEHSLRAFLVVKNALPQADVVLDEWRQDLKARSRQLGRDRAIAVAAAAGNGNSPRALWLTRRARHVDVDLEFVDRVQAWLAPATRARPRRVGPNAARARVRHPTKVMRRSVE